MWCLTPLQVDSIRRLGRDGLAYVFANTRDVEDIFIACNVPQPSYAFTISSSVAAVRAETKFPMRASINSH